MTMFHLTSQYDTTYHFTTLPSWSFPYGGHGVTLFFVISGFVIFMTLERTRRPWDFVVSRFSRLYPTYWAALILATAALLLFPLPGTDTSPARLLGRAAVNVTMFQRWFRVRSVDPVYWTLEVELCFYLIMLALLSGKALKYAIAVFTGLTLLALADQLWGPRVRPRLAGPGPRRADPGVRAVLPHGDADLQILGDRQDGLSGSRADLPDRPGVRDNVAFPAASGALVYLATTRGAKLLEVPGLQFLGMISYPLYLVHFTIGTILIHRLTGAGVHTDVALATALACVLVIAASLTFLLERPAMRAIRRARARTRA